MRNAILHDEPAPKPEDVDWSSMTAEERQARRRAEFMIQEASIIELTHWPFAMLDEQPYDRMQFLLSVISTRSDVERERRDRENRKGH